MIKMKKILSIIFISLLLSENSYAEEIYLRCVPKITTVREGDFRLKVGNTLKHRFLYAKFKNEINLKISENLQKNLEAANIYIGNSNGKKDKLNFMKGSYSIKGNAISFDYESNFETKTFKSFIILNFNYDGGSWVSSGTINNTEVDDMLIKRNNFSWFGKCLEITKKDFKKPIPNYKFEKLIG
jgi:hypothetical protein